MTGLARIEPTSGPRGSDRQPAVGGGSEDSSTMSWHSVTAHPGGLRQNPSLDCGHRMSIYVPPDVDDVDPAAGPRGGRERPSLDRRPRMSSGRSSGVASTQRAPPRG